MKKRLSFIKMGLLCLCGLMSSTACSTKEEHQPIYNEEGQIQIQFSADSCTNANYKYKIDSLKECGFTNFKVTFMNDVKIGLLVTEDSIDTININGKSNFEKDDFVDAKSVVFMRVHSKNSGVEVTAKPLDGQVPIMYENTELNGRKILDVVQAYKNIGFTNFVYDPIRDCSNSSDYNMNKVTAITVDGKNLYYSYDCFATDVPIKITYHTTEDGTEIDDNNGGSNENNNNDNLPDWLKLKYDFLVEPTFGNEELGIIITDFSFTKNAVTLKTTFKQTVVDKIVFNLETARFYYDTLDDRLDNLTSEITSTKTFSVYNNQLVNLDIVIKTPVNSNIKSVYEILISGDYKGYNGSEYLGGEGMEISPQFKVVEE